MTIKALCTGDTVTIEVGTSTQGAALGKNITYADVSGKVDVDCRVDLPGASESTKYQARGQAFTHTVFFHTDQSLGPTNRLKWTKTNGNRTTISPARFLRVLSYNNRSNNPSGSLVLWIAECQEEPMRQET